MRARQVNDKLFVAPWKNRIWRIVNMTIRLSYGSTFIKMISLLTEEKNGEKSLLSPI